MSEKTALVLSIYPDGSIKDDSQDLKLSKASNPKAAEKYCKELVGLTNSSNKNPDSANLIARQSAGFIPMPIWSNIDDTIEQVMLSRASLHSLKKKGFTPGVHWVYLSGGKNGSVGWNVEAIKQWQIERTQEIAVDSLTKDIETYTEDLNNA